MKQIKSLGLMLLSALLINVSFGQNMTTVQVGGAPMYPTKNIVENAVNSKDHTTLVAAVKAAGLVETLEKCGPVHRVRSYQYGFRQTTQRHC